MQRVALNNVNIHIVISEKCLSITFDSQLTWDIHTRKLSKAFSGKVEKLHEMRYFSKQTLETVYFKGILPAVLYGILLWSNCAELHRKSPPSSSQVHQPDKEEGF